MLVMTHGGSHHNAALVVVSILIAVFASYTALDLATRLRASTGRTFHAWLAAAAVAMGGGIWSMHFVAMLAFHAPAPVAYDPLVTLLSFLVAVAATGGAFFLTGRERARPVAVLTGGVAMGAGIVAMHYIGMAAMRTSAALAYDGRLVALSLLIAIGTSAVGLWLAGRRQTLMQRLASALALGAAVAGMHYTGMAAARFTFPGGAAGSDHAVAVPHTGLAVAVAAATLLILILGLVASGIEQRREIRRGAERLRLALQAGQTGIWDWDRASGRVAWSDTNERLFGLPPGGFPGTHAAFLERVHPDDRGRIVEEIDAALERGAPIRSEFRILRPDGTLRHVHARGEVIRDAAGRPIRVIGANVDITERKQAEENNSRLAAVVEGSEDAIIGTTLDGVVTSWNRAAGTIFGYAAEEIVGRPIAILFPPDRLDEEKRILGRVVRGERVEHYQTVRRRKDGRAIAVSLMISPIRDAGGRIVGASKIARDVTEQKRTEAALRESEERLRLAVAAGGGIGTWVWDVPGNRFHADERTARLFSLDPTRAADGLPLDDVVRAIHPEDRPGVEAAVARCLESGGEYEAEYRLVQPDGSSRWVSARGRCERDASGQPTRFPGVVVDITERKRIEEDLHRLNADLERRVADEVAERLKAEAALRQAQKMEAVGQLTGGIAHDFNNLLTAIGGNLELIERGAADERTRRLAAAAQRASERAARLTAQLLAFSRRQTLCPEIVDAGDLVREFEDLLRRAVGETIHLELLADMPLWPCHVDPTQFEAALLNLTLNARDAMADGGTLRIEIRNVRFDETAAAADLAPGAYVTVAVADSGLGMPPETVDRVFEPFFTTKEAGKGTGLGLSMVYGFAKQSGGHVSIESEVGRGTTVTLYLPRAETAPEAEAPTAPEVGVERASGTVLVVEDDADVLLAASATLAELGCTVLTACSGVEALEVLRTERRIDLLFSDVVMPHGMSGVELVREAIRLRPEIKVLLTSGYAGDALKRVDAVDRFPLLGKPYRRSDLAERLQAVLGQTGGRPAHGRDARRGPVPRRAIP